MSKFHFASCPIVDWVMKAELGAKKPECKCEEIRVEVAREMFSAPTGANEQKTLGQP